MPRTVRPDRGRRMPNGAERLRRIAELARSVSSALDLEAVLDHVTAAVSALRPDAACSVRLIDQLVGGYRLAGVGGVPIGIAEILTGLWLLIRGIKIQPVESQARINVVAALHAE